MRVERKKPSRTAHLRDRSGVPPRRKTINWEAVRASFMLEGLTRKQLAEKYHISTRSLDQAIKEGRWREQLDEYQRNISETLLETCREEVLQRKAEAIRMIYRLKLLVIQRLQQRLQSPAYEPTTRDLEVLQRMEMDLRSPGWSRASGEGDMTVNVAVHVETLIAGLEKERRRVLRQVSGGMDPETAGFLYLDDDDDDGDGGSSDT